MKELVFAFWDYSLGKTIEFKFVEFFKAVRNILYSRLALHGCLGLDDYIREVMEKYYDIERLRFLEYNSVHTNREFTMAEIMEGIFRSRYEHHKSKHKDNETYKMLSRLYYETENYGELAHTDKVLLVDRCISAMHHSGLLLDTDALREEYNKLQ